MKIYKKLLLSTLGIILLGIGVGLIIDAKFGTDPLAAFITMISTISTIKYGTAYLIVNASIFIFQLFTNRKTIFYTTIVSVFAVGYIADFTRYLLSLCLIDINLIIRILFLLFGIIIADVGVAFTIESDAGISPYDAIPVILSEKFRFGKYKVIKTLEDFFFGFLAITLFLLHNKSFSNIFSLLGIGTIVSTITSGIIIDYSRRIIRDKIIRANLED